MGESAHLYPRNSSNTDLRAICILNRTSPYHPLRCPDPADPALPLEQARSRLTHNPSADAVQIAQDDDPMGSPDTPRREIEVLLAEAGLHRDPLATLRAPARQHRGSALSLHARSESVLLRALTPVRLESALGHEKWLLLIRSMAFRQTMSINDLPRTRQTGIAADRNSSHRIPRCVTRKIFLLASPIHA